MALVRGILSKLPGIKAELVQGHPEWQSWNFTQLLNALREWKEIHPRENVKSRDTLRSFHVEERTGNATRGCVYCRGVSHKAKDCTAITSVEDRRKYLQEKRLCFNCTGPHRATNCRSRGNCANCKQRHHTSICDRNSQLSSERAAMTAAHVGEKVCHPDVVVKVNGVKCRALLDTGATGTARAKDTAPSLNECLKTGSPLQNQIWRVRVCGRFHAVAIAGDIRKAFLQVRIREEDRDALRFHWIDRENPEKVRTLRFTRALFGLGPSPFLLGGVIQHHLEICKPDYPETVPEIERGLYVDDLLTGGPTVEKAQQVKKTATEIFAKATFTLHKWNSNARELELTEATDSEVGLTYAKEQLGEKPGACGLLGLRWNKEDDKIAVTFPTEIADPTKRGVLCKIAKIYDPIGLAAPVTLQGKIVYRDICKEKTAWDAEIPLQIAKKWSKWENNLPDKVEVPRSLAVAGEEIREITLHAFGDASGQGLAAAVYAVVQQHSVVTQGLVAAKARLAKEGLTIPRLELVAGHMAANLLTNVRDALIGFPVKSLYAWLDSSVAQH